MLFSLTAPIADIYSLNESPSWVGPAMQLSIRQPHSSIISIVSRLPEDKALEEGEEYEFIPVEPLEPKGDGGPQPHSTPKKKDEPIATVLAEQFKHLESQELQQILSAIQLEMKSRQDASIGPVHEVSSILQTLLKDGALRTNISKLSTFSGERAKGEVSFEQWSYELQTPRKTYNDSALQEGIQCSLRGAAADTVRNMAPDVPLDTIIKKFTMMYGNVKSFDLLMQDFYCADQGKEESISSFATQIEGLLSKIRNRFLDKLPHPEEQRLLKDHLFHGCKKSIWDSVKYCFIDPHINYMHLLEECREAEDEDKVGQAKTGTTKAKVAAATVPPTREDELAKQLKYQQHQIDTFMGQVKNLGLSCQNCKGLLQRGHGRWLWEATPKHMEKRFEGKGSANTDSTLNHSLI